MRVCTGSQDISANSSVLSYNSDVSLHVTYCRGCRSPQRPAKIPDTWKLKASRDCSCDTAWCTEACADLHARMISRLPAAQQCQAEVEPVLQAHNASDFSILTWVKVDPCGAGNSNCPASTMVYSATHAACML